MKTVGIIGGFGPVTTAKFQLMVIDKVRRANQTSRPPILSWNTPIPLSIENKLIHHGNGIKLFLPFLINAAKILEKAGADFLVLPCNTLHLLFEDIAGSVNIPILNIIDETIKKLKQQDIHQIGLLATKCSIDAKLHIGKLTANNINVVFPANQNQVDTAISRLLTNDLDINLEEILLQEFHQTKDILLGCTDLQLAKSSINNHNIFDSLEILAEATAREILN
ncbi:MAG TPA: amino acid racemase [Anaerolineales bacterium]|nr:amino acid racemase [Anaerolineales bacterium]